MRRTDSAPFESAARVAGSSSTLSCLRAKAARRSRVSLPGSSFMDPDYPRPLMVDVAHHDESDQGCEGNPVDGMAKRGRGLRMNGRRGRRFRGRRDAFLESREEILRELACRGIDEAVANLRDLAADLRGHRVFEAR